MASLTLVEWVQIASAIGAVGAAAVGALAAIAAFRSVEAARNQLPEVQRQVEAANLQVIAAQEQVKLQRQTRMDELQPQVWADIRFDDDERGLLSLVIGNNGPSIARNVKLSIGPPIVPIEDLKERFDFALARLRQGLPSMTPGRMLTWPIGQSFNIISDEDSQRHLFTLTADGPFGPMDPVEFTIDLADLRGSMTM